VAARHIEVRHLSQTRLDSHASARHESKVRVAMRAMTRCATRLRAVAAVSGDVIAMDDDL
jgi:hypothetical protein